MLSEKYFSPYLIKRKVGTWKNHTMIYTTLLNVLLIISLPNILVVLLLNIKHQKICKHL